MSKVSEDSREREAFRFAPHLWQTLPASRLTKPYSDPTVHATTSSSDAALTAFAQLAAFRLDATRCLISIFDRSHQYIVAEATATTDLTPNVKNPPGLWLGGTAVPRTMGICEHVLLATPNMVEYWNDPEAAAPSGPSPTLATADLPISFVPNLAEDERFCDNAYIDNPPYNRFYAGVPIRSPKGINIGVFCVFGSTPREELDHGHRRFLRDISQTVMGYLDSKRSTESYRRSERMVRGLGSFVEGKSTISRWWLGPNIETSADNGAEGALNTNQQNIQNRYENEHGGKDVSKRPDPLPLQSQEAPLASNGNIPGVHTLPSKPGPTDPTASVTSVASSHNVVENLTEDSQLLEVRRAFGKAANIIRESLEVEGVVFVDANVKSFGGMSSHHARRSSLSAQSAPSASSSDENLSAKHQASSEVACSILGVSTTDVSSIDEGQDSYQPSVSEKLLRTLLRRYPIGQIFNFDENGGVQSGASDEEREIWSEEFPDEKPPPSTPISKNPFSRQNEGKTIFSIFPGARSLALVPLWDSQKEKWSAGAFVWTRSHVRTLTMQGELSYLRAFGMSIMAEVSRISTRHSEKVKSDLLGSLSHELRSPLHGIVAAVELLHDTDLDAFQGDLVHSMEACGRTLLDVIDHLLDYSKINRFIRTGKENRQSTNHGLTPMNEKQKLFGSRMTSLLTDVRIDALAEESIESVYTGHNFLKMSIAQVAKPGRAENYDVSALRRHDTIAAVETLGSRRGKSGALQVTIGSVAIYLDIDPSQPWVCCTEPGALRRIIMNILGNSLKFTTSGFVHINIGQEQSPGQGPRRQTNLKITVSDSGKGIGAEYLHNEIFRPFTQEDPLNAGTGIGLSLVHHLSASLGGSVSIESLVGRGTSVVITLPLSSPRFRPDTDSAFEGHVRDLSGLRVSIRGLSESVKDGIGLPGRGPPSEYDLVASVCREWLHLEVIPEDSTEIKPDFIICTDLALSKVSPDSWDILPPVVIICRSAIAAHSLLVAHSRSVRRDVFEFISQPAGPRKLAKALVLALGRWNDFRATVPLNSESSASVSQTPFFSDVSRTASPDPEKSDAIQPPASEPPAQNSVEPETIQEPEVPKPIPSVPAPVPAPDTSQVQAVQEADAPARSNGSPASHESEASKTKYLLVDDNRINLQILVSFMKRLKNSYKSANNGLEALEAYRKHSERYCCILMDISMPVMDGLEATRRIREYEREQGIEATTIIALTGLASASTQEEAFASGIDLYLTKPVRLKELTKVLVEKGFC